MKNMRKLVPAFAMLMVAAIMMSTASFAWFSMNTTASASGMQVKAQSTGGFAIAAWALEDTEPGDSAFTQDATMGWNNANTTNSLVPVSFDNAHWTTAEASVPNASTAKANSYKDINSADGEGYYLATKWSVKSLAESGTIDVELTGITVTIEGETTTSTQLKEALRVVVYNVTESKYYHFAPCHSSNSGLKYVAVSGTTFTPKAYDSTLPIVAGAEPKTLVANAVGLTPEVLYVYIYFEGEDQNCTSSYAVNAQNIAVKLNFTAK